MQNFIIDDEIDLSDFFSSIFRNKTLIATFSIIFFLISLFYGLTRKKIWEGEFQIVLESEKRSSIIDSLNPSLAGIIKPDMADNVNTQVAILESPSVLMNIFNYVKEEKNKQSNSIENNLRFKSWKKSSVNVELEKGTSVLNVSYKDHTKDLIIPVLKKISLAYQDYSGKKRSRSIELNLDFLKSQLPIFRKKSEEAISKVQKFSDKHLLLFQNNLLLSLGTSEDFSNNSIPTSLDIDIEKTKLNNQIKISNNLLNDLKLINDNTDEILFFASNVPGFSDDYLLNIKSLNEKLVRAKATYTENDIFFQNLNNEKIKAKQELKIALNDFLRANKINLQARLKATERPQEVIDEYRSLLSKAIAAKLTLNNLEKQYINVLLDEARKEDPWELITNPTLLPYPINSNIYTISLIGLFLGGTFGTFFCYFREKNIGKIFNASRLNLLGEWPFLYVLPNRNALVLKEYIDIIIDNYSEKNIAILYIGEVEEINLNNIKSILENKIGKNSFILSNKVNKINDYKNVIVIINFGLTKEKEIIDTYSKIKLTNLDILGILAFEYN